MVVKRRGRLYHSTARPGAREGAFSDVYTTGNIGAGLLREFRVVFDYGNKRVAFVPLKAAKPDATPAR